ncbi:hypothetical protein OGATHE_000834 [Ogataea polymorpha]|uniref:Uncharacterized protein n=1 Tax=Ogataea polymorpha TaxID=460523 RepID=A0A9P8TG43_9ASCO|nr:hypothetical protein OGATHE_000834 [Ogataea polymorpha]
MASTGDNNLGVDGIWIHTRLIIMVHGNQSPVGNNTSNSGLTRISSSCDQILNTGSVEKLDIRQSQGLGTQGGDEQCCVFDNNVVTFVLVLKTQLSDE